MFFTQQTRDKDGLVYTLVDLFKFWRGIIYATQSGLSVIGTVRALT